ncbi:PH domain-containing protein [Paenilisteria rocourtiae]|uniref:Putative membrane protein n=1 Tax=Listeria rocourtiae TaxID=647910 RepID=A0A4R6ZSR4_9LIST|nr:PH domain-containing protein [Listeria rocourtiae]MBC1435727.1 PH domain-containing protein [Listeria rocourtiae]MBC1605582.1 PH domain-containing protein [Listeria rocourtiae]TDR55618.1 putative membrane protein [Listeria rocourtiae]
MYEDRRLHPIALIKELIVSVRQSIIPIAVVAFTVFRNLSGEGILSWWMYPLLVLALIILLLAPALIKYFTYRYRMDDKGIRVKYGLFFKKNIFIPYERIQTVQQKQWFFYMPFHVVQILIETAGGGKAEADLSAVPVSVAQELKDLRAGKVAELVEEEQLETEEIPVVQDKDEKPFSTFQLEVKELLLMAVTSGGVFGVFLIILALSQQFRDVIPTDFVEEQFDTIVRYGAVVLVIIGLVVLLILWGIAIVTTLFKYFQFKLMKFEDHLVIEKGLLQREHTSIAFERIQSIKLVESPLRQMLKLASVRVVTAGSSGDNEHSGDILILPIVKKAKALEILPQFLEDYEFPVEHLERAPKTSLRRFLFINVIWTIPVILLVSILLFPWGLFSLVLLPLFAWKAYAAYRATGFCTTETELVIQGRPFISKQTNFMLKRRVQSVNYAQSIWMKKGNVVHFSVLLKSGQTHLNAGVHYIAVQDANQLYYWYQPSK